MDKEYSRVHMTFAQVH